MSDDVNDRLESIERLLLEAREEDAHWHMKKEVTVAHILSTIGMVGLVVASWYSLQGAVASVEQRTANVTDARVTALEMNVEQLQGQVKTSLLDIKVELRRLSDRMADHSDAHADNSK